MRSGPPASTEVTEATFDFAANRPDVAGFRCSLDGAAFAVCSPPLTLTGLTPGPHSFRVATVNVYGAVDATPAAYHWTVLGPAPTRRSGRGATPVVTGDTAIIDFGCPETRYECSVDGGAFQTCTSPFTMRGLAPGPHTLDVRAVDADGRADPTPQRYAFDVPGHARRGRGARPTSIRTGSRTPRRRCRWATCRLWPACGRW